MQRRIRIVQVALLCAAGSAWSQSGGPYDIRRSSTDGGGQVSTGGVYSVSGSIGQPDASQQTASGGAISVTGGFWAKGTIQPPPLLIFSDGFESE